MEYLDWILLIIAGSIGGLLSGMLGVGGGTIFVPIITFVVNKYGIHNQDFTGVVMANSFFVIFFIGLSGTIKQKKLGIFYPKILLYTAIPAILISLIISKLFVASGYYSKELFTVIFVTLLVFILYRFLREVIIHKIKVSKAATEEMQEVQLSKFLLPGGLSGLMAAISGLGGGIVMIPYFTQVLKIPVRIATAISLSVITLCALPLVILYLLKNPNIVPNSVLHTGFIIWELAIPLMLGALATVRLGVNLSKKLPAYVSYLLLSAFVIITIVKMLHDL
jgi:uncharacterized membrane protein YfcA